MECGADRTARCVRTSGSERVRAVRQKSPPSASRDASPWKSRHTAARGATDRSISARTWEAFGEEYAYTSVTSESPQKATGLAAQQGEAREGRLHLIYVTQHSILKFQAQLTDADALERLIGRLPACRTLRTQLRPGHAEVTHGYDHDARAGYYIGSDGELAVCYTVTGVTLRQAGDIAAELTGLTTWAGGAFEAAAERALGAEILRVQ